MRLTWKDATATLLIGAIVAVYLAFLSGTSLWLISSARGATAAVLVLGIAGCAMRDLHATGRNLSSQMRHQAAWVVCGERSSSGVAGGSLIQARAGIWRGRGQRWNRSGWVL